MSNPDLLGLDAPMVWDAERACLHLNSIGQADTRLKAERRLHELAILPAELRVEDLENDPGRRPVPAVLNREIERARSNGKLVLFAQLDNLPGGNDCLHANDARGVRYWVPLKERAVDQQGIASALQDLQSHIGKDIAVFPHGRLGHLLRQTGEPAQVSLSRLSNQNAEMPGSFILIDRFSRANVAAGAIHHSLRGAQNVHTQALSITRSDREKLNGYKARVIWFTGLSGSGKSTIANALEMELHAQGLRTYILDGDNVRQGLTKDLGFTDADRVENIRRIAEVAKLMMDAGLIVMTAFISPFRREREMARELIGSENFLEVYVSTPLEVCEQRDVKGLYKKARSGLLHNFTGLDSPYEAPERPDIELNCSNLPSGLAVKRIQSVIAPSARSMNRTTE